MILTDMATYTPSAVADLFPVMCGTAPYPEAGTEQADMVADLHRAVCSMGYSSQGVRLIYRREVDGLSDEEIGHTEGLPPGMVRTRIEQGLKYLSDFLNGRF